MIGKFPEVLNLNWLFSNSTGSSATNRRFSGADSSIAYLYLYLYILGDREIPQKKSPRQSAQARILIITRRFEVPWLGVLWVMRVRIQFQNSGGL